MFARYDPQNLLLRQADREVLERQLDRSRLAGALERLRRGRVRLLDVAGLSAKPGSNQR